MKMTKKSGKSRQIVSRATMSKRMLEEQTADKRRARFLAELEGYRKANEERKVAEEAKKAENWATEKAKFEAEEAKKEE